MKTILLFALFFLNQTNPELEKVEDKNRVHVFNSIEKMEKYHGRNFTITVFTIANPPGSAGFEGTGEISNNLLIATSEFDEFPRQNLFELKDILSPKIIDHNINEDNIELVVEHYSSGEKEKSRLLVSFNHAEFVR